MRGTCNFFGGVSSYWVPSRRPAGKGTRVCAGGRGRECGPVEADTRKLLTPPKKLHIPAPVWYRAVDFGPGRHSDPPRTSFDPSPSGRSRPRRPVRPPRASSEAARRLPNTPEGAVICWWLYQYDPRIMSATRTVASPRASANTRRVSASLGLPALPVVTIPCAWTAGRAGVVHTHREARRATTSSWGFSAARTSFLCV